MSTPADNDAFLSHSLGALLHLGRRARQAGATAELGFIVVNETLALAPYRQAALWVADRGVVALSGVVAPEANAPFVHWLERVLQKLLADKPEATAVAPSDLATDEAAEWDEWLPAHALWLPLPQDTPGGVLLARDTPWQPGEIGLLIARGAPRRTILALFLGEAVALSALGGLLGLLLGIGLAQLIHFALPALPVHTPLSFVLLAEFVAIAIGLAAGVLPARRAAQLDPVEALRTE